MVCGTNGKQKLFTKNVFANCSTGRACVAAALILYNMDAPIANTKKARLKQKKPDTVTTILGVIVLCSVIFFTMTYVSNQVYFPVNSYFGVPSGVSQSAIGILRRAIASVSQNAGDGG